MGKMGGQSSHAYAVKCNPHRYLLAVLAALGAGFDCASRAHAAVISTSAYRLTI